jgi:hypothetical protein
MSEGGKFKAPVEVDQVAAIAWLPSRATRGLAQPIKRYC